MTINSSIFDKYSFILSNLGVALPAKLFLKRIFFVDHFYFLTVNLNKLENPLRINSDINLEKASDSDWSFILENLKNFDAYERKDLIVRYLFYQSGFSGCFIGKNKNSQIVSMQWIIKPEDNQLIKKNMNRLIPLLKNYEVMVENIFIFPDYRGLGIFQSVNYKLLGKAKEEGYKACNTCIRKDNINSLNEFMKLGFRITKIVRSYNMAGISWRKL